MTEKYLKGKNTKKKRQLTKGLTYTKENLKQDISCLMKPRNLVRNPHSEILLKQFNFYNSMSQINKDYADLCKKRLCEFSIHS